MQQQDNISKLNEPVFSRRKSLLTVGQYAARQGVSASIVQECARLGVVQVRKHRDKTFIVDLPLDIYNIIKQQDLSDPGLMPSFDERGEPSRDGQSPDDNDIDIDVLSCTDKISGLASRTFQPAETVREHDEPDNIPQLSPAESSFIQPQQEEPDTIPDLHLFAEKQDQIETAKNKNEFTTESSFRISPLRSISESIRAITGRRLSLIIMVVVLAVSLLAYVRVSTDRKIQQERLRQTYESINTLSSKYEDVRQQARLYEFDMINWQAEAQRSKNALMNSETELRNVRKSLSEARRDLENMRQYNTEALKELNEKITRIRSGIPNTNTLPIE